MDDLFMELLDKFLEDPLALVLLIVGAIGWWKLYSYILLMKKDIEKSIELVKKDIQHFEKQMNKENTQIKEQMSKENAQMEEKMKRISKKLVCHISNEFDRFAGKVIKLEFDNEITKDKLKAV